MDFMNVLRFALSHSRGAGAVDIGEMTWEQKEKVLRHLFVLISGGGRSSAAGGAPGGPRGLPGIRGGSQSVEGPTPPSLTQQDETSGCVAVLCLKSLLLS